MPELSPDTLLYGAAGLFALAVLLFLISLRLFRRSRRDVFWRRRREAGQRGWRLFVLAFTLFVLSGVTCASTLVISAMRGEESPDGPPTVTDLVEAPPMATDITVTDALDVVTAETPIVAPETLVTLPPSETPPAPPVEPSATPTEPPVILPTDTPLPPETVVVIVTATPGSTPTHTPFPTFTPNALPLVSDVTPAPDASLEITALDDEVSDTPPASPDPTFPAGTPRIYVFVSFENLSQGVLWRRELYRNNELLEDNRYLWGLPTEGRTFFFFGSDQGFEPGSYEVRLYLGEATTPASSMSFTINATDTDE